MSITLANLSDILLPAGTPTSVTATGAVSAVGSGIYWINRSGTGVVNFFLPASPVVTTSLLIKDIKGDAGTYPITITDPNGKLIDGQAQLVLNSPYAAAQLAWNGTGWSQIA